MSNPHYPFPSPSANVEHGTTNAVGQPDFSISDDGRGLLQGSFKWYYHHASGMPPLPGRGSTHPMNTGLGCIKAEAQYGMNNSCVVTADYIGIRTDPTFAECEVSSTTGETSMVFHPRFAEMAIATPATKTNPNYKFKDWIDTVNNNGKDFERFNIATAPANMGGVESFLTPRATVRVSFYTKGGAAARLMGNIGKTASQPLYANGPMPTGGNFLLTGVSVTPYGNIYKVSAEWTQSELGKTWNKEIYKEFGSNNSGITRIGEGTANGLNVPVPFSNSIAGTAAY
jgi:hypothetical protein